MVFCNINLDDIRRSINVVTILILIDGFLQYNFRQIKISNYVVTILILIDGFLQFCVRSELKRWGKAVTILILIYGFLQYETDIEVGAKVVSQSLF